MNTTRITCHRCSRDSVLDDTPTSSCPYCGSDNITTKTMTVPEPPFLACMGFAKLNSEQQKIVRSTEGLIYVEAGPGTAKTTTLIARTRYIIHARRDNLHTPLILTFTNQAVERITQAFLNERPQDRPQVYTLHSFAYRMLLKYRNHLPGPLQHFRIMNEDDWNSIIRTTADGTLSATELKQKIRLMKGAGTCILNATTNPDMTRFIQTQLTLGLLDFDDLLPLAVDLLRDEYVLQCINDQYRYVLVDESQDLTDTELELLNLITLKYRNLFLVGDSDQSIYGWRGAKNHVRGWLDSLDLLVHTFLLTLNYRSSQAILNTAKSIIEQTPNRTQKPLTAVHSKGPKVLIKEHGTALEEARMIANSIELATDAKIQLKPMRYSEIAVLTRNRKQLNLIRTTLQKKHIPVHAEDHSALFDTPCIVSVLSVLSFLASPDMFRFSKIADWLIPDGRWQEFCADLDASEGCIMEALNRWYDAEKMTSTRASSCIKMLNDLQRRILRQREDCVLFGVNAILDFLQVDRTQKEIITFLKICKRLDRKYGCDVKLFLDQLNMERQEEQDYLNTPDHLALMTLHAAKGREFKKVFLAGLNASVIPASKGDTDEERRLLYVGITRAKDELILSYVQNQHIPKDQYSPFLEPLKHCDSVLFCRKTKQPPRH